MDAGSLAFSGSLLVAIPVAVLAGLVSFASPCVLPLVPGYIGYVSGMSAAAAGPAGPSRTTAVAGGAGGSGTTTAAGAAVTDLAVATGRGRVLAGVALFVAGFTVVFVTLMAAAGAVGVYLVRWDDVLFRVLGVVVILLGLSFMGLVPWLQREARLHLTPRTGLWGAPVLGIVFGLGWTPCMGPTLAAVQALALDEASLWRGALLGVAYCVGLGVPFLLVALGATGSDRMMGFLRRHRLAVMRAGGALLVAIGLALVTGLWAVLTASLQSWINGFETVL
ncbi:cytochrome c biogenesis CcdA family protein [Myceligenerans pegani]|uniref:Cytochrome c biogenesis protein CcdA n=1 Tax=Myceligenerans pegani TaxID=2776917 RepID=A0ABR9N4P2_9MICO|nr:cytochrome c biogenesis protein CcdA [Myceligenerans sp. TRM 65318]MBE1878623.1 cytochrome c biogenesis protein CcdA [Myceligenerans sp. TRM 65318]MBE3020894.1 cytochrome c biogenesis protein CcdA [Myceligenerans sp. TRM 65318]